MEDDQKRFTISKLHSQRDEDCDLWVSMIETYLECKGVMGVVREDGSKATTEK